MKCDKKSMLLYAVTDRAWVGKQSLYEQVESALKGGVTCVQLREKELDDENLEFRYCSKCNGNYEYCQDHLFTHTHVKKTTEE